MAKNEDNIISLIDDEGNEVPFELLDIVEYEGGKYLILYPLEDEDDGAVLILQAQEEEDGNEGYVTIEDEGLLDTVFDIFRARNNDTFTFGD